MTLPVINASRGSLILDIALKDGNSVTVRTDEDALTPAPSTQGFSPSDLLDASSGCPGVPLSIPGTETASGASSLQYFAPGVAGDHGEPIAQFFQVGGFSFKQCHCEYAWKRLRRSEFVIAARVGGVLVDNAAL